MTDESRARDAGSAAPTSGGVDTVLSMIRQVGSLASSVGFERSFKATAGRLYRDRFLLGVDRPGNDTHLDEAIDRACIALGMPPDHQQDFRDALADANHVYFGAERGHQSLTVKAYLEFRDSVTRRIATGPGTAQSHRLYTGYKWAPENHSHRVVSHYLWYPFLPAADIVERVGRIIDAKQHAVLGSVISRVTERALEIVPPQAIQFLEVREEGSARASFDINIYKAGYRLDDLRPLLLEAIEDLAIARDAFEALLQHVGAQRVGHLAGGVDRDGRYFLTVYYGGRLVDGDRLRLATLAPGRL